MADLSGIQSNNLTATPFGNVTKSITPSGYQKANQQDLAQVIEQKKPDISQQKQLGVIDQLPGQLNGPTETAELDTLMKDLNTQLQKLQNYLKFERDEGSQKMVVFVKDSETDELIRQIPTQEFLAISKNINQYIEMRQQLSEKMSPPVGIFTNETV